MTASSLWKEEHIQVMRPGDQLMIGGYVVKFAGAERAPGPNYEALQGRFAVDDANGRPIWTLIAERRSYPVERQDTTEAAIRSTLAGDLYAVIGEPQGGDGAYVTRLFFKPLVPWIWCGVGLMVLGGLTSLSDRRHRVGAPARRGERPAIAPSQAESAA
jgi:cytochrome c-type biogenesis protein CcmF